MISDYLKDQVLIMDGAMGTYYSQVTNRYDVLPEFANIDKPEIIEEIHRQYISAGARLIRTNTFSANSIVLNIPKPQVKDIITAGVRIANKAAANKDVFVGASIGPVPERIDNIDASPQSVLEEYRFISDVLLDSGVKIFIFETFNDFTYLKEVAKYIKQKDDTVFISAQFATTPEGFTRKGISNELVISEAENCKDIDAYGFNCGVGPTHLYNLLKKTDLGSGIIVAAPNSGYPEIVHERTVYIQNPDYFAERMQEISRLGVKILGGCCGTTPAHIQKMSQLIKPCPKIKTVKSKPVKKLVAVRTRPQPHGFMEKLKSDEFVIAVELDPPFNTQCDKIIEGARMCKENGVDIITIADSPMGRARMDPIMLGARIKREVGIEVMPHICCRDRNLNALKAGLLAGYIENIRNILAVTGDPVAAADRDEIKPVFNFNSLKLMEFITTMNNEVFSEDPVNIGGALNLNVPNPKVQVARARKKAEKGAAFFLTQPIFDDRVIDLLPQIIKHEGIKVLGGIMPLVSYRNALFLNNEVAGINIPDSIVKGFDKNMTREEGETLGIEIALSIADKIKEYVHGFYFITPFNRVEMIMKIINKIR
ncbi:MAG: bifunctional homocysteine S-methyltransferase/methylenetetrahydrofolate reductase [Mahellales bacterium]|jgi:methionine synthase I (cobalamin-dependent)/5,10-methylenetetrahydrofolate reductase